MLTSTKTGLIIAALALSAGVAQAEWRGAQFGVSPPGARVDCPKDAGEPCVRLWRQMNAAERADLWSYLDEVVRASHWREMSREEREAMQAHLSDAEREAIRQRFSVERIKAPRSDAKPKLCSEERSRMRRQIMEVHMKYMQAHPRRGGLDETAR